LGQRLVKHVAKRLLGDKIIGIIDYYLHPDWRSSWGGALNGQRQRQEMVAALIRHLPLHAIVETGTYRGTTTAFLASMTSIPIHTVEHDERNQGFAFSALRRFDNVRRYGGDSRTFLRTLAAMPGLADQVVFFYLDAHGKGSELPLAEEIEIIFKHWKRGLVLIDDFQVPDDDGYGYDNYGPGQALTYEYLTPAIQTFGLCTFYPSIPSTIETGHKRGCVALAADADLIGTLRTIPQFREWTTRHRRSLAGALLILHCLTRLA
jgi:hypothetical protein